MSYRDLRNFSEAMRVLGFPRPISLESFRVANWQLMEECLRWLATRVEPDAELPRAGNMEQRVALVTQAISLFHSRANVKLNGKKLYGADGWAVRELLKVAAFLRAALHAPAHHDLPDTPLNYDVTSRLGEIKQARSLATEITAQGAFLYDLLAKEPENKLHREGALSRALDLSTLEGGVRRALAAAAADLHAAGERAAAARSHATALQAKIERRRQELSRAEKRLTTVQKIKPAYQGELSQLEGEIAQLWDQYVLRYRCVEALRHQLSMLEQTQAQEAEEQQAATMQLIHKYEAEDVLGKLSDSDVESSDDGKDLSEVKQPRPATRPKTRLRIKTAGGGAEGRRAFGSMAAARDSLDEIRDEDDSKSDSDFSDRQIYGVSDTTRWRPRPATRTLAVADDDSFADLIEEGAGAGVGVRGAGRGGGSESDSLGSSSESELRLRSARSSAAPPAPPAHAALTPLSDNEF